MAKIVKKIDELTGNDENTRILKEQFGFLQKMAEAKCEQFKTELQNMFKSGDVHECEIVGKRAFAYNAGQHVDIKSGCGAAIKEAINMFFSGEDDIKEGFKKIVETALDTLIGNTAIGEHSDEMFFVYPENFAIVRVDFKCYKYCFSSNGIIANSENIFCYTMSKSIVDHKKMTIDELVYMITEMIGSDKIDEVSNFINKLKEVWTLLEDKTPQQVAENYMSLSTIN